MSRRREVAPDVPRRGFGVRPGTNPPIKRAYATPVFAARNSEAHWTIFDWATGETIGTAAEFGAGS